LKTEVKLDKLLTKTKAAETAYGDLATSRRYFLLKTGVKKQTNY
jgi:hypothetical protein